MSLWRDILVPFMQIGCIAQYLEVHSSTKWVSCTVSRFQG
jgi:hypothetical protein